MNYITVIYCLSETRRLLYLLSSLLILDFFSVFYDFNQLCKKIRVTNIRYLHILKGRIFIYWAVMTMLSHLFKYSLNHAPNFFYPVFKEWSLELQAILFKKWNHQRKNIWLPLRDWTICVSGWMRKTIWKMVSCPNDQTVWKAAAEIPVSLGHKDILKIFIQRKTTRHST